MKRILFSIGSLEGGGAEKVLLDLVNRLCGQYDITVQTIYNEGLYREQLDSRVHYRSIIKKPTLNKKRVFHRLITYLPPKWTYRLLVGRGYDISVAFLEGISSKLISGGQGLARTVSWIHTDISTINPRHAGYWHHQDQARCYARFDQIVCVSGDAKKAFINTVNPPTEPEVIINPIDNQAIVNKAREAMNLPEKRGFTFCSLGRLVPVKAFDRVLRAVARLKQEGLPCCFWLLGEGAEGENLKALARELDIQDEVVFWGFQKNPYPILQSSDAYVCSSLQEGYPLAVAEALVLKKPVVATLCTGSREIINDGEYGLLTENSEEGVYQGMKACLNSPDTLLELQEKAVLGAASFDRDRAMQKVYDLFARL